MRSLLALLSAWRTSLSKKRESGEPLDVVTPTYQDKKPGETITAREAAKDLNRTEVAPTEAADYEARLQRRWAIHRANDACSTGECRAVSPAWCHSPMTASGT